MAQNVPKCPTQTNARGGPQSGMLLNVAKCYRFSTDALLAAPSPRMNGMPHSAPSALASAQARSVHVVAHLPLRYTLPAPEQA